MAWRKSPPELIKLFDSVALAGPRIERRKMFGYPAAFVNGNLYASLFQDSFILKLSEADRDRLRKEHGARGFEPVPGRAMREYMVVPNAVRANAASLRHWLARSIDYVASLPPKGANPRKPSRPARRRQAAATRGG